ncbi:MAG: stage III sporulation protein AG [Oscillospiraceae bacterium]|nr:stage III sporulation protein AG [Oscillospiraceae bacterium]
MAWFPKEKPNESPPERGTGSRAFDWKNLLKGKAGKWIVVAGVAGMLLLMLSSFLPKSTAAAAVPQTTGMTAAQYITDTEARLTSLVGGIQGAGECQVMVTLENGVRYVYATQGSTSSNSVQGADQQSQQQSGQDTFVIVDTASGKQGLLITEVQPTVKGVVIVCAGGDNADVRQRVTQAVTTALGIPFTRVCVTK